MKIRSLAELTAADERSQRFTPWGLATGARILSAAGAARHIQQAIAIEINPSVPETVRKSFERVRSVYTYGLFDYELFSAAADLALLHLQQAFAERFMAHYGPTIPFVSSKGQQKPLTASSYDDVHHALHSGSHRKGEWYVPSLVKPGEKTLFRGSLNHFFAWARMEHLLHGQRSRRFDRVLPRLRNRAAHPTSYLLHMPTDAAPIIRDVIEIVNRLWGARTPGGRIFPAPTDRAVVAIGWDAAGSSKIQQTVEQLAADDSHSDWTYLIVRAVEDDDLWAYDSDAETTRYPVDYLWGPGSRSEALEWSWFHRETSDTVEYLDRWFAVRVNECRIDPPRNPRQFLGLPESNRSGRWYLIRADHPYDAFSHARSGETSGAGCPTLGLCDRHWVDVAAVGTWQEVADVLTTKVGHINPQPPIGARVPADDKRWEVLSML
jgi:hypothetical protein